jgi:ATP-binding protein involved in chromosome partitioning
MTIKKIIAIASAKGGVGKSSITAALALNMSKSFKVGILDADIYGPNQHILFNLQDAKPNLITVDDKKMFQPVTHEGISINSMGFILDADKAAVWRGPMLSGAIRQLIESTIWGDLDFLFIDMPPGTGDAYLTIASEIKPDACILVTTPNKLAVADLIKTISTMNKLAVNISGYVENNIANFKTNGDYKILEDKGIPFISSIPFDEDIYHFDLNNSPNGIKDLSSFIASTV